jgi:hypothetical protein
MLNQARHGCVGDEDEDDMYDSEMWCEAEEMAMCCD